MTVQEARTILLNNVIAVGEDFWRLNAVSMNAPASPGTPFEYYEVLDYEGYVVDCLPSNGPAQYDWVILSKEKED
jgi:hypothetical protein